MKIAGLEASLSGYESDVEDVLRDFEKARLGSRLWAKDPAIWKEDKDQRKIISNALGWLDSPGKIRTELGSLSALASELKGAGIREAVHMGMGGSSLAPMVLRETFGSAPDGLPVTVLDSTDPATIIGLEKKVSIPDTFFIEASKSGSTVESRSFGEFFYNRLLKFKDKAAGGNMAVVTDPGSMLEKLAAERSYRKIFLNYSDIGGRYSALSFFGLVPAALMGIDLEALLERASIMVNACGPEVPATENPGLALGAAMGALALKGRNKLTFLIPEPIGSFGMWLEQLIAESTGKEGVGIVPVSGERSGAPEVYGKDRFFIEFRIESEPDKVLSDWAESLRASGQPVLTVRLRDRTDLGAQFFLWEIATAAAGAVLRINPFDQPNVQETKEFTVKILQEVGKEGRVPEAAMEMAEGPLRMYLAGGASSVRQALSMFFAQAADGDYLALLAYLTEEPATENALQDIRTLLRDRLRIATTTGYGPRYLHSTGQLHKGGPNTGLFVVLTSDIGDDAEIPGQPYTFGMLMRAQALGDFEALRKHRRRAIRVHLGKNIAEGLKALEEALKAVAVVHQR